MKFDMPATSAPAVFQGPTNSLELMKRLGSHVPTRADPQKTQSFVVLDKAAELPRELKPLADLCSRIEVTEPTVLPEEVAKKLAKWVKRNEAGGAREIPMKCLAESCPYKERCPLLEAGLKLKPFQACPLEDHLMERWSADLASSLNIDTNTSTNAGDLRTINHSSLLEVTLRRNSMEMAEDPSVVEEVVIGVDPKTGEAIKGKRVNEHVREMQNIIKAEENIHSSLLATRKAKAAVGKSLKEKDTEYLQGALQWAEAQVVKDEPVKPVPEPVAVEVK